MAETGLGTREITLSRWTLVLAVTLIIAVAAPVSAQDGERLTDLVDPFIGTGGHGHTYPGPSLPFGMIQPGPDTRLTGWDSCSGYYYSDTRILGFSHTHLSGTGIPDYADVLLMPTTGPVRLDSGADGKPGYSSTFTHADEAASPGYYAVTLRDHGVRAELTTTLRVGLHRYTFPAGRPAHVLLDLVHRDEVLDASIEIEGDRELWGHRRSSSWAKDQQLFFAIRFSRPFASSGIASDGTLDRAARRAEGTALKAVFDFGDRGGPLLVKVGISAVSINGARRNLDADLAGWDFDEVRRAADEAWERELSKIRVEGGTRDQRVTFYTALYHAMLTPNVFMDADGRYRGRDLRAHRADGFTYYSVFSLWDTFRALHPLLTLIDRQRTTDFVKTMLRQYEEGGRLPVWELAANETDTMIGYHAVPVIADAIRQGLDGFDPDEALDAMTHSAEEDRFGLEAYKRQGYIDGFDAAESVSRTLEYAFDDWTIAMTARRLGREDLAGRYLERAQAWKHLFDPATGFMRARVEGHWFAPFDPAEVNNHYTEANAWQYSFFVPHDVENLMAAYGGPAAFGRKLDALVEASSALSGREQADITGLVGQYAHGNEPSHHVAYLYAFAGQAWKTQAMVRRLMDTMYAPRPDGLSGNEDCGQMSAWFVLSALGFYPVAPASGQYVLGSPLFPAATIRLESGRQFVVRANGVSTDAMYVRSARLNGAPYGRSSIDDETIAAGGELAFEMGDAPNTAWGAGPGEVPRSANDAPPVVPVPFVHGGATVFRGETSVELGDLEPGVELRWTTDDRAPESDWRAYAGPITLSRTATVRAVARRADGTSSVPLVVGFHEIPDGRHITLAGRYAGQYSAGGDEALIDTLRGGPDFRRGRWQGYRGTNLTAVLDLGSGQDVREVAIGFLQEPGAWILMPRRVRFEVSEDGRRYRTLGVAVNTSPERTEGTVTRDFAVSTAPVRARYVRVTVERHGPLPDWHPGKGEEAWFFADEIVVR